MRENRTHGSEGGESGSTGLPYPYSSQKTVDQKGESLPRAPRAQRAPQAPQQRPLDAGYFAAPQQSGTVSGGSNSIGIEGFALHFPAISFKLPTIEFPAFIRMRNNPKMMLGPAQAPYVQNSPMAFGAAAVGAAAVGMAPRTSNEDENSRTPRSPKTDAFQKGNDYGSTTLELQRQLADREDQLASLQQDVARLVKAVELMTRLVDRQGPEEAERSTARFMERQLRRLPQDPNARRNEPFTLKVEDAKARRVSRDSYTQRASWSMPLEPRRLPPPTRVESLRHLPLPQYSR